MIITRNARRLLPAIALVFASTIVRPAMATCTMETQMANAQQAEQTRRLNNINANMQTLTLLNQLQTACLQGFQSIPTQYIGNSAATMAVLSNIEQSACRALTNQARSTAQSAMAAAQAQVQQQINSIASSVIKSTGSSGLLFGAGQGTSSTSSGWSNLMSTMSRMFQ